MGWSSGLLRRCSQDPKLLRIYNLLYIASTETLHTDYHQYYVLFGGIRSDSGYVKYSVCPIFLPVDLQIYTICIYFYNLSFINSQAPNSNFH
jgi:hypothetical protein